METLKGLLGLYWRSLILLNARGRATARLHEFDELMMLMSSPSWLRPVLEVVRVIAFAWERDLYEKNLLKNTPKKFTRKFQENFLKKSPEKYPENTPENDPKKWPKSDLLEGQKSHWKIFALWRIFFEKNEEIFMKFGPKFRATFSTCKKTLLTGAQIGSYSISVSRVEVWNSYEKCPVEPFFCPLVRLPPRSQFFCNGV